MSQKRYGSTGIASLILVMMVLAPAAQAQLSETKILASDGADGDLFGESIAIDGNRLVVGVRLADVGNDENAGAAYVFEKENGEWKEVQKLISSDVDDRFFFGESVALDGNHLLIAETGNEDRVNQGGAVHAFEYVDGQWQRVQIIYPSDPQFQQLFGWDVALEGDRAFIGAPRDDELGIQYGAVYAFEWNAAEDEWEEVQKILPDDNQFPAFFGSAIGLDGDRILIGSLVDDEAADNAGAAYIFELDNDRWVRRQKLLPPPVALPDSLESDTFAREVALEGDWALIGSSDDERCIGEEGADPANPNVCSSGAVFAFQRQGNGDWDFKQKIAPEELDRFDFFGTVAIAIENERAFIGALGDDDACPDPPPPTPIFCDTGATYVYDLVGDEWQKTLKLTAAEPDSTEGMGGTFFNFGRPIGVSGSHVVVGAPTLPFAQNPSPNLGQAYIFKMFNRDPVAQNDQAATSRDTAVEIPVLRNDSDPDFDKLTLTVTAGPSNGFVAIDDTTITYTPNTVFSGIDAFTYQIDDGDGGTDEADVTINVAAPPGGAPTAPQITSPFDGAEVMIGGDAQNPGNPDDPFVVEWTESIDPDGDEIDYDWQLSDDSLDFEPLLLNVDTGSENRFETTAGTIDALLEQAGVGVGGEVTLFHRAVASDGQNVTPGPAASVRLVRGVVMATATEDEAEIPATYHLSQNYPNPFNPETRIRFALPVSGEVRLAVYDVLGREVAVLVAGRLGAGRHEAVFEASELPSGVYVYQLETARRTLTRTMLLLK